VAGINVAQAIIKKILLKSRILSFHPEYGQKEEIPQVQNPNKLEV
jgi:hypothetical protein